MSVTVGDKNKSVQSILDYTASPRPIRAAANNLAKKEVYSQPILLYKVLRFSV